TADGRPVKFGKASHTYANGKDGAAAAIDSDPHTGWSISGGAGRKHAAVFNPTEPLVNAKELALQLLFERYYAAGLGRFRIAVTSDPRPAEARLPAEIEELVLFPAERRTAEQCDRLMQYYL